jgi:two-component system, LytTR family, response regulator
MKKRILIVDDEQMARERIKRFLSFYKTGAIEVSEAENAPQALEMIKTSGYDVIFLDIQMPVMSGFDLLYQLEERPFQIIFQTAYDEFAVKAFEVNACDYLLKPFTEERLLSALNKALTVQASVAKQPESSRLEALEQHLEKAKIFLNNVTSKNGAITKVLRTSEIYAFKSEDHYTFAMTSQGEFIIDNSLSFLEKHLDPQLFIRTHRSHIVKNEMIDRVGGAEEPIVYLKGDIEIPLSREGRKKVLSRTKYQSI